MAQIPLTGEIASFIAARIADFPTEAGEQCRRDSQYVAEFSALPLYFGWIETIGIRPDGQLIRWSTEGDYLGSQPVDDRIWTMSALVEGARKYPELAVLLPIRGPEAVDCRCRMIPLFRENKLICSECG